MVTLCTHCGITLKDSARYCNNCGTLVPSHLLSSQSVSSLPTRPLMQTVQERSSASPTFTFPPDSLSVQDVRQTPPQGPYVGKGYSVSSKPRHKSHKLLAIVLVSLVLLLVVGGLGAWVVVWQPFSVPGITQPQQSFKDTQLGFSLLYPNGWRCVVDQRKAIAHFYDSSSTDQVNIVVRSSNGEDLGHYLQQEASRLGMTGQKNGTALSFAGALWQQMQGGVLERGASYTETLVVTIHKQHLFTMLLLAPQLTYAQEDQLVFSGLRSSFQFVS